jgi:hypothetical protein
LSSSPNALTEKSTMMVVFPNANLALLAMSKLICLILLAFLAELGAICSLELFFGDLRKISNPRI